MLRSHTLAVACNLLCSSHANDGLQSDLLLPLLPIRRLVPAAGIAPICYEPTDPSDPGYNQMCTHCPRSGMEADGPCHACRDGHAVPDGTNCFVCSV